MSSSSYQQPKSYEMDPAEYEKLLSVPGNERCADCGKWKPDWGSPKLGILLCVECAGRHRGLGTHISFVRSVHMDHWTEREMKLMYLGGNRNCNAFLEKYGVHTDLKAACNGDDATQAGGNGSKQHFNAFAGKHGIHTDLKTSMSSTTTTTSSRHTYSEKYDSRAAELYRQVLKARADGLPEPTELPPPKSKSMSNKSMKGFGSSTKYNYSSSKFNDERGECCTSRRVISCLIILPILASAWFAVS